MRVDTPSNLNELREALHAAGSRKTRLLAGGTDLLVHLHADPGLSTDLVDLSGVSELKGISLRGEFIEIGACTTFCEIEKHPLIQETCGALARAASLVGSPQIRNLATIGGNLANASPAADSLPPFCALEASLLLEDTSGECTVLPPGELATAPGRTKLRPDQYIRCIRIPLRRDVFSFFAKAGSRKAVAISKLSLALVAARTSGHVRIFAGSLGTSPLRMKKAEGLLDRRVWNEENRSAFLDALSSSVEEAIPGRASLPFKRLAVRGLGDDLWSAAKEAMLRE